MLLQVEDFLKIEIHFQADKAIVYRVVEAGEESQPLTDELVAALKNLWSDGNVRIAYERRNEYQLTDSAK